MLKSIGLSEVKDVIIYPFATGMALSQVFLCLKNLKKIKGKIVILRIDQKTCYKCIESACLEAVSIENLINE